MKTDELNKIQGIKECLKLLFEDSSDEELEERARKCYKAKKKFENIIRQNKVQDEVMLATLLSLVADKDYKPKLEGERNETDN